MDSQKQSAIDRIKQANTILVTVSTNPTVDQLAACIGLTLMLDKLGKHGTAVFSGTIPSTIEFLQPDKTIQKNTDSLQDFIIALDKAKADKLRYKVEDKVVKIFITPYRSSITEKDLEFSQGDFNIEVVVALGVHQQQELDQAITAHGRILHDATVISINTTPGENIGTINWQDEKSSSLSEMVTSMADSFDKNVIDNQMATALLTGIVAETDRFSNDRTTPDTMKASAQLMAAGANQQLVATKLEESQPLPPPPTDEPPENDKGDDNQPPPVPEAPKQNDGTLRIDHDIDDLEPPADEQPKNQEPADEHPSKEGWSEQEPPNEKPAQKKQPDEQPPPGAELPPVVQEEERPHIHIDERGRLQQPEEKRELLEGMGPADVPGVLPSVEEDERPSGVPDKGSEFAFTPPAMGGMLTANTQPEGLDPAIDPFSPRANTGPLLQHDIHQSPDTSKPPQTQTPILPPPPTLPSPPPSPPADDTGPPAVAPVPPVKDTKPASDGAVTPPDDAAATSLTPIPDFALPEPVAPPPTFVNPNPPDSTKIRDNIAQSIPPPPPPPPSPVEQAPPPPPPPWPSTPPLPFGNNAPTPEPLAPAPTPLAEAPQTLSDIEHSVDSPHLKHPDEESARATVDNAIQSGLPAMPQPIAALNAQPLGEDLHKPADNPPPPPPPIPAPPGSNLAKPLTAEDMKDDVPPPPSPAAPPAAKPIDMPLPVTPLPAGADDDPPDSQASDSAPPPPPVPPPMMPPLITPSGE